jgi:hypothetical protein
MFPGTGDQSLKNVISREMEESEILVLDLGQLQISTPKASKSEVTHEEYHIALRAMQTYLTPFPGAKPDPSTMSPSMSPSMETNRQKREILIDEVDVQVVFRRRIVPDFQLPAFG